MARVPFKLKSQGSSFKEMGSTPKTEINLRNVVDKVKNVLSGDWKTERLKKIADKAAASPDGLTNFQRRQADRAAQRESGGKSKYQRDIIKKQADRKATKAAEVAGTEPYDIKSSSIFEPTKFGYEGKSFFGPTTSDLDRKLMMQDIKNKKLNLKSDVFDLSKKTTNAPSAQEMINMAYKGTNDDWDKASKNAMDMYGTTLTELIGKRDSPVEKKSPYKKGLGSYAKKAKGSRGYKMNRNN